MITIHELTKCFHAGGVPILAVDHVSFHVHAGEVYGLLGPNGAGKTTTIRMIVGLLQPDHGFAEVAGFRTSDAPDEVKARVGLVSANDGVYPWLTVREMLLFFADLYGLPLPQARENLRSLAELFGLSSLLDRRCSLLSTGQRQRVILARALIHAPPTVLLDEPTRGLDVLGSETVVDYVRQLRKEGKAVIISTHRLDEAERLCDRFGLLHQGCLRLEGTLPELSAATGCTTLVEMFRSFFQNELPASDIGLAVSR
ncbi:MAG TPA: ATP-binding cassette domain-containing protein [Lacipirellulaceae bacterium]|nr:ATP-binding cassette domain-containing protein [Lacipirellulaceae bacterium]